MYVSMTGFSRYQLQSPWGTLSAEISSVNHRYQEISVKLPREFSGWEPWFHQRLRKVFRRGKVQFRMEALWNAGCIGGAINKEVLRGYCEEISLLRRQMGLSEDVAVEQLTQLPGVVALPEIDTDGEGGETESVFDALLNGAAASWQAMRETEGAHLKEEITRHLEALESLIAQIEDKWAPARDAAFEATRARMTETLEKMNAELDEGRYLQEIVIMNDRWDVSEEIARLKSHIKKFRATGDESESSGRKLDFLIQEMNREVNTLDSKIADAGIRWLAVEAKASLERIREQIQNLE